jgi:hypothetical protein
MLTVRQLSVTEGASPGCENEDGAPTLTVGFNLAPAILDLVHKEMVS